MLIEPLFSSVNISFLPQPLHFLRFFPIVFFCHDFFAGLFLKVFPCRAGNFAAFAGGGFILLARV